MNSTTKLSAHYTPTNSRCYPYTCTNNLYFQDSTRFVIRKTCNPDCTNFTLTQYNNVAISAIANSSAVRSIGQCFEDCFDTAGCYAFSYGNSVCSIYTSCGTSCDTYYDYGTTVYTRTCHTDCGSTTAPVDGTVQYPAGTTYGGTATFQCDTGYYLSHLNNRTCLSSGVWSMTSPQCVANDTTVPGPARLYLAPCICYPNKTFTGLTQDEIIQFLIESIRIEPNSTALAHNRLKCAEDSRLSSRIMGSAGAGVIATVFGILIYLDILTLCQTLGHMKYSNLKGHKTEITSTGSRDMSSEPINDNKEFAC